MLKSVATLLEYPSVRELSGSHIIRLVTVGKPPTAEGHSIPQDLRLKPLEARIRAGPCLTNICDAANEGLIAVFLVVVLSLNGLRRCWSPALGEALHQQSVE